MPSSSWKQPESKMVASRHAPAPGSLEAEEQSEAQEMMIAQQKAEAKKKADEDKVGALLGASWYIINWTDPCLLNKSTGVQMTVSRFYPQVAVALDIFTFIDDHEKRIIEMKREAFKKNKVIGQKDNVRYAALSYADPLSAMIPQIEENS